MEKNKKNKTLHFHFLSKKLSFSTQQKNTRNALKIMDFKTVIKQMLG